MQRLEVAVRGVLGRRPDAQQYSSVKTTSDTISMVVNTPP
jgi:hypothetical protein